MVFKLSVVNTHFILCIILGKNLIFSKNILADHIYFQNERFVTLKKKMAPNFFDLKEALRIRNFFFYGLGLHFFY